MNFQLEDIVSQVKGNCNLSDAKYWGYYSMCGMLMRMRELYRQENSMTPFQPVDRAEISAWIADREALWESLEDNEFGDICIDEACYDPFDIKGINGVLNKWGILYGAGYGIFKKPMFFLSGLSEKSDFRKDFSSLYGEEEYCRDLSSSISMFRENTIIVRLRLLSDFLCEKFLELKGKKFKGTLYLAFTDYGIHPSHHVSDDLYDKIVMLAHRLSPVFHLHELGEALEDEDSTEWLALLDSVNDKTTELYLRGVKDIVADTTSKGPLNYIIKQKERGLLSFFILLLGDVRTYIFPEIIEAYRTFVESNDWDLIKKAGETGYTKATGVKKEIIKSWKETGDIREVFKIVKSLNTCNPPK